MGRVLVKVARLDQIVPGKGTAVQLEGHPVALFNAGGKVRAVDDSCVRCGTSLAAGSLAGDDLRCPGCGWHYDVATGCVAGVPGLCIDTFAVSVADSDVMLATESPPG